MNTVEELYEKLVDLDEKAYAAAAEHALAAQELASSEWGRTEARAAIALDKAIARVKATRAQLKTASLAEYEVNGEKRPHNQVGISISKKAVYLESEAIDWAKENRPAWITLPAIKKRPFEKYARAVAGADAPLDFVSFEESASVTIKLEVR